MKAKDIAEKLERYEQKAYEGGYGIDWLEGIGINLKYYMIECDKKEVEPTMRDFLSRIDEMHKKAEA
ncbi:hypothetical protein FLK61_26080 [Paenalkalicoccus suaedae]|uniref:Uncharacterized protein n=1 Tax=Paenalkalicoccus suaedae TaxID=2592382 RepID=A0A859FBS4_9BACI|nr:hypothetical protein [Paenalkalicoccus suaedae]QKS70232.1 hypothetical protein FLK61_26080 [Paenalkalicoccus suaedae]